MTIQDKDTEFLAFFSEGSVASASNIWQGI